MSFVTAVPASATLNKISEVQMGSDSNQEIEPALLTYTQFGVEYSVSVFMQFVPNPVANPVSKLRFYAWTSTGLSSTGDIPELAGYDRYADPWLAKNPTTTSLYLTAVGLDSSTGNRAVVVWYSTNGGWTWSSPAQVATSGSFPGLDKPTMTVGPDNRVWFTYITHAAANLLYVRHGTRSGSTWTWGTQQQVLANGSFVTAPQIMVDSNYDVYILYTNNQAIQMVRDVGGITNGSVLQFETPISVPGIGTLYAGNVYDFVLLKPNVSLRVTTIPVAKLDRARRRISVAWHESGGGYTRIRFAAMRTDIAPLAWTANPPVIAAAGGHDVNVGMDFDPASGNYLVTYYSFPAGQSYYFNVGTWVYFDANGYPQHENVDTVTSRLGDIADYTPLADDPNHPTITGRRLMGEYHDASFTNGTFKTVHIVVSGTGNPWTFIVSH